MSSDLENPTNKLAARFLPHKDTDCPLLASEMMGLSLSVAVHSNVWMSILGIV